MPVSKTEVLARLQKEILPLQGLRPSPKSFAVDAGIGIIKNAFPNASFPLGGVHEFMCTSTESITASAGFVAAVLASLTQTGGALIWISTSRMLFPPALKHFGLEPHRIIFVHLKKEKEALWAIEEALQCSLLCAVIGEVSEIGFTESRRLQLAAGQSGVPAFLIRNNPRNLTTASLARWRVRALSSTSKDSMPGLGFPSWNVELLKVRNGRPSAWQLQWVTGSLRPLFKPVGIVHEAQRKVG